MDIQIRTATNNDAELLAGIIRHAFSDIARQFHLTPDNCPSHPSNYTIEMIQNDFRNGITYYLAEVSGQTLGCIGLEESDQGICNFHRLAVLPEARRQGIGKVLVQHAARVAGGHGAKTIHIAIIAQHAELQKWYETIGFRPIQTRHFAHLPFDVTFMNWEI